MEDFEKENAESIRGLMAMFVDPEEERARYEQINPATQLDRAIAEGIGKLPEPETDLYARRQPGMVLAGQGNYRAYHENGRITFGPYIDCRRITMTEELAEIVLVYDRVVNRGELYINLFEASCGLAQRHIFSDKTGDGVTRTIDFPPYTNRYGIGDGVSLYKELDKDEGEKLLSLIPETRLNQSKLLEFAVLTDKDLRQKDKLQRKHDKMIEDHENRMESIAKAVRVSIPFRTH